MAVGFVVVADFDSFGDLNIFVDDSATDLRVAADIDSGKENGVFYLGVAVNA